LPITKEKSTKGEKKEKKLREWVAGKFLPSDRKKKEKMGGNGFVSKEGGKREKG